MPSPVRRRRMGRLEFATGDDLAFSPLRDLVGDRALVARSPAYGRARLGPSIAGALLSTPFEVAL
jgi:hypothetical protein